MKQFRLYFKAGIDLLLPRTCIVCERKLLIHEKHICLGCLMNLPLTYYWKQKHNPMADKFNALIQKGLEEYWETQEESKRETYAYACSLFFYNHDSDFRRITQDIKYKRNIPAGKFFGKLLGRKMAENVDFQDINIVIPVPLHWRRKWERGYNQAELIGSALAEELGATLVTDVLKRVRVTKTQTQLSVEEKGKNVKGAFTATESSGLIDAYREEKVHVLILDDVFTTGATLYACFMALREILPHDTRISVATLAFVGR